MAPRDNSHEDIRYKLIGKQDKNGNDYFVGYSTHPVMLDMSNAVFFFFPYGDEGDARFGGELVIKYRERRAVSARGEGEETATPCRGQSREGLLVAVKELLRLRFDVLETELDMVDDIDTVERLTELLVKAATVGTMVAFMKELRT